VRFLRSGTINIELIGAEKAMSQWAIGNYSSASSFFSLLASFFGSSIPPSGGIQSVNPAMRGSEASQKLAVTCREGCQAVTQRPANQRPSSEPWFLVSKNCGASDSPPPMCRKPPWGIWKR